MAKNRRSKLPSHIKRNSDQDISEVRDGSDKLPRRWWGNPFMGLPSYKGFMYSVGVALSIILVAVISIS